MAGTHSEYLVDVAVRRGRFQTSRRHDSRSAAFAQPELVLGAMAMREGFQGVGDQ